MCETNLLPVIPGRDSVTNLDADHENGQYDHDDYFEKNLESFEKIVSYKSVVDQIKTIENAHTDENHAE